MAKARHAPTISCRARTCISPPSWTARPRLQHRRRAGSLAQNRARPLAPQDYERRNQGRITMRRMWLVGLLWVLSAGFADAQISGDVVKIGVLTDLSGPA